MPYYSKAKNGGGGGYYRKTGGGASGNKSRTVFARAKPSNNSKHPRANNINKSSSTNQHSQRKNDVKRVAEHFATHATTGSKLIPTVTKIFKSAWGSTAVMSNGGTVRIPKEGTISVATPQARSAIASSSERNVSAVYRTVDKKGQHYVGQTSNVIGQTVTNVLEGTRIKAQLAGKGARVTHEDRPTGVDFIALHATKHQSLKGETKLYHDTKDKHGPATRGAGNTARRSFAK